MQSRQLFSTGLFQENHRCNLCSISFDKIISSFDTKIASFLHQTGEEAGKKNILVRNSCEVITLYSVPPLLCSSGALDQRVIPCG